MKKEVKKEMNVNVVNEEMKGLKEMKKEIEKVMLFGEEIEKRNLSNQELVNLLKEKFDFKKVGVGEVVYYILGLKKYEMININYVSISMIVRKLFDINGIVCNCSDKCVGWYMNKINNGKIDIKEKYKSGNKRVVSVVNIDELIF